MLKHAKALSATITNSNAMCLHSNDNSNGGINIVDVDNANTFSIRVDPKDYTRFYIRIRCDSNSFYISKFDKPQDGENGIHGRGPIADTMAVNINDEIIAINDVNVNKFNLDVVLLSAFLLKKWRESSLSPMILTFARNKTFTVDRTAREKVANKIFKILESTATSAVTNSSLRETASTMETLRLREAESIEAGTKSNGRKVVKVVASNNTNNNNDRDNFISEKEIKSKSKRDNSNSKGSSPKPRGTTISNKGQSPKKAPKKMHDDDDYEDDENDNGDDDDDGNNFNAPKSKIDKLKSKSPSNTTLNTSSNTSTLSKKRYRNDEDDQEFDDDNGKKSGNNDCNGDSDTGHPCDDESSPFFIPLDNKDFAKRELDRLRSETKFLPEITVSEFMELAAVTKEKNPIGSQSWFRYGATATGLGEEHPGTTIEYHSSGKFVKARWGNGKDNWCWCQPEIITSAEEKLKRGRGR